MTCLGIERSMTTKPHPKTPQEHYISFRMKWYFHGGVASFFNIAQELFLQLFLRKIRNTHFSSFIEEGKNWGFWVVFGLRRNKIHTAMGRRSLLVQELFSYRKTRSTTFHHLGQKERRNWRFWVVWCTGKMNQNSYFHGVASFLNKVQDLFLKLSRKN